MNPQSADSLERRDGDVPTDAETGEDAARFPLFGQQHHAGITCGGGAGRVDGAPGNGDGAAHDPVACADQRQQEIGASRADQSRKPDDFAGVDREGDVAQSTVAGA